MYPHILDRSCMIFAPWLIVASRAFACARRCAACVTATIVELELEAYIVHAERGGCDVVTRLAGGGGDRPVHVVARTWEFGIKSGGRTVMRVCMYRVAVYACNVQNVILRAKT
jgi:hypothetical protein